MKYWYLNPGANQVYAIYSFIRNAIGCYYFIHLHTIRDRNVLVEKCSNGNPSSKDILSTRRYSSQPNQKVNHAKLSDTPRQSIEDLVEGILVSAVFEPHKND